MTLTADFAAIPSSRHAAEIERLCDAMEAADKAGCHPRLTVERPWSAHNPVLEGEFAGPRAIRCAGLRNRQEIGDLVLATAYMRDDRVLDDILPLSVPVVSNHTLNTLLLSELTGRGLRSRMGIVFTTANRNWELHLAMVEDRLRVSRALAVDMESATVAANGFRYRVPTATLLAVSDKPLHARPKLSVDAQGFYTASRRQHVEIAIAVAEKVRHLYPGGLPTADLRSPDEPLLGITGPEATPGTVEAVPRGPS